MITRHYLSAFVALLFALIMAKPLAAQQSEPVAARRAEADRLFVHGRLRDAARVLQAAIATATAPSDEAALQSDLVEVCATAEEWDCVERTVEDALRVIGTDQRLESYRPRLVTYFIKLMVWRGNEAKIREFLASSSAASYLDPLENSAEAANLWLALHDWLARRGDVKGAEQSLSQAMLALLSLDRRRDGDYRVAQVLVDLVQSLRFGSDIVGATALATRAEPFIAKLVSPDSAVYARYLFETAQLLSYTNEPARTAARFSEAIQAIERLDMADEAKAYDLAIANGMASAALVLAGDVDEAKAVHARHPMQAHRAAILERGSFASQAEFYFAVSDVFVSGVAAGTADRRWKPLFAKEPDWHFDDTARREFEAFRNFTLGTLTLDDNAEEGTRLWRLAARERISNYDAAIRGAFEGFVLPSLLDRIILALGLRSAAATGDRESLGLMLAGSELLGRSLRHTLVDAAVLLDSQEDAQARADAHAYLQLARRKRAWELDHVEQLLAGRAASSGRGELARRHIDMTATLQSLEDRFASNPRLVRTKGLPTLDALQQNLAPGSAYVTYFATGTGVGKLCVTHDAVVHAIGGPIHEVASDARLLEFATTASYPPNEKLDAQFPVTAALHLRDLLFGGLEACLRPGTHVTVSLPSELAGVPLGALLQEAPPRVGEGYDLAKAHWLIRDFDFSLVVSARQFLAAMPYLRRAPAPRPYLGVGDPKLDGPRVARSKSQTPAGLADLPELPDTVDELKTVAALFAAPAADIMIGAGATEAAFRAKPLPDYDVIHFATHGLLRDDLPGLTESALVLTPATDDASDDGLLLASEIFRLSLDARLVVLSACNTAKSDIAQASNAVQDLQTAFTAAGAPTLLASLWPLDSATARDLMVRFFAEWRSPAVGGAADALARATRAYLDQADAPHQHPRFWAPFVVAGNGGVRSVPAMPVPASGSAERGEGVGRQ